MNIETKMSNKDRFFFYVPAIHFGLNEDGPFLNWLLDEELPEVTTVDIEMVKMDIDRLAILWEKRCYDYVEEQITDLGLVPYFGLGCDVGKDSGNKVSIDDDEGFEIDKVILNQDIVGKIHGKKLDKFILKHITTIKNHVVELSQKFMSEDFVAYLDSLEQADGEAA